MVEYSAATVKEQVEWNLRFIIALDAYAQSGELDLESVDFVSGSQYAAFKSVGGRIAIAKWANSSGSSIFSMRQAIACESYSVDWGEEEWESIRVKSEVLIVAAMFAVEHLDEVASFVGQLPSPFMPLHAVQDELLSQLSRLQAVVDRYCSPTLTLKVSDGEFRNIRQEDDPGEFV